MIEWENSHKIVTIDEEENVKKGERSGEHLPPAHSVTAVAISGSKKSKYVVQWALEKFVPEGQVFFKILHVRPVISWFRTPMGNYIPIAQVQDDIAAAYRKDAEWRATEQLLPYKKMFDQRRVQVEILQIESNDVETAIAGEIQKNKIGKLVIGTSSRSFFSRGSGLSSKISKCCPSFCTVYAVSKGKGSSLRPSDAEINASLKDESSVISCFSDTSLTHTSSSRTDWSDQGSEWSFSQFRSTSLPAQRFQALSTINENLFHKRAPSIMSERSDDAYVSASGSAVNDGSSQVSSFRSSATNTHVEGQRTNRSSEDQAMNFELEKLRVELRHVRGMYAMAQGEAIDASRKLNTLHKRRLEEEIKLEQVSLKEQEAEESARQGKERYEAAKKEANLLYYAIEQESSERKDAESKASGKAKEKENLEKALAGRSDQYQKFTWEEIICATSSFSENLKIGMGAYGTVYKCSFHHTTAAVKVLHAKETGKSKQFLQELEILSQVRHPHLLILLGACPERGCLVYEYMENGSLEDRLYRKNNTPPLLWFDRYRIALEVASALVFLHNARPKSIIHRDLKPANILLDRNYVSKIGDVGLSTIVSDESLSASASNTALVGTLCYIDPEYQRTGVISPESDVYAFGIVVLQLLTGKPAIALAHSVEKAMESEQLEEVLDPKAGEWPIEETKHLAIMALKCTELRQRDRPNLRDVLPALEKLNERVGKARDLNTPLLPNHFICPILKEVMAEPCVAADGYTYDRKGIEAWLEENNTSPMTNLLLPHKLLVPNYTLLSAIMEWKSGSQ